MGCHRRLSNARLLHRSGFGFVTFFVARHSHLRKTKKPPNPRAFCIGHSHSFQLFSISTLAQLAGGSRRSSRTFFHLLHSFRKPPAVRLLPCSTRQRSGLFYLDYNKIYVILALNVFGNTV